MASDVMDNFQDSDFSEGWARGWSDSYDGRVFSVPDDASTRFSEGYGMGFEDAPRTGRRPGRLE